MAEYDVARDINAILDELESGSVTAPDPVEAMLSRESLKRDIRRLRQVSRLRALPRFVSAEDDDG